MSRKTLFIITAAFAVIVLLFGVLYLFRDTPFVQNIGLFPGEGLPVVPIRGEREEEEANIPITISGEVEARDLARLYELHKTPVAGVGFMETGLPQVVTTTTAKKSKTKVKAVQPVLPPEPHTITARYLERGLGHIYETLLSLPYREARIVNETRPRIAEALFANNGKSVVVRYAEDVYGAEVIRTRILNLPVSTVSATTTDAVSAFLKTEEILLSDRIPFMSAAEDGTDNFFYLTSGLTSSSGFIATSKGASTGIFNSSFTEWLPQFPNQNLITLATRPSSDVPGYLFSLDPKTKVLTKVLDGINGLTAKMSRDGKRVLYSTTKEGRPELSVYDVANKESRGLFIQTLSEKCAWSAKEFAVVYCAVPQVVVPAVYPDQWYRGTISFADRVWKINIAATSTAFMEKVFSPEEYRAPEMDIINPVLSSDDSYLLFMNKKTGTPWVYRIIDIAPAPTAQPFTPKPATTTETISSTPTTASFTPAPNVTDGMTKIK